MFGFGKKREEQPQRQEAESGRDQTPAPMQEKRVTVEDEIRKQEQEFRRAAARLEMSIEDTANALSGGIEKADPNMREKIIDALVSNIREIPQEKRMTLLNQVRANIDARVEEARMRQLKDEEIKAREANARVMKEVDSRLFIELPDQEDDVIELTEVVDDNVIELDFNDEEEKDA